MPSASQCHGSWHDEPADPVHAAAATGSLKDQLQVDHKKALAG